MNDFTKEELNALFFAINELSIPKANIALKNKLQSMIDNYCEHEDQENIGDFCWRCKKCGFEYDDERF